MPVYCETTFQEDVLNNCVHDFFVNESLGEKLDLSDEHIRNRYRNSFDWFGFGIVDEADTAPVSLEVAEAGAGYE